MFELKDKVVFITGAATGIGSHVVRILMKEGVRHVAILDLDGNAGNSLETELNAKHGANKVKFYRGDVTSDDDLFGVYDATIKEYGYIDVVINNAGILNDSLEVYKKEIQVNVTAVISSSLKALELMRKDQGGKGGVILNISSIAAMMVMPDAPIYSATKSAVLMFSNGLGLDEYYSKTGVKVITVAFGVTDTTIFSFEKMGCFDKDMELVIAETLKHYPSQSPQNAAQGVVDACKQGDSGSTWVSSNGKPVRDVTATIKKAYELLTEAAME